MSPSRKRAPGTSLYQVVSRSTRAGPSTMENVPASAAKAQGTGSASQKMSQREGTFTGFRTRDGRMEKPKDTRLRRTERVNAINPQLDRNKGGAPNTNRTCDLPLRRGLLYPLSYRGDA